MAHRPFVRRAYAVLATVLIGLAAPSMVQAASPAPSAPSGCPAEEVTLETLIGLRLEPGPVGQRYGATTNEAAAACYGSTSLRFDAFVASPEGLGGAVAYGVDPAWLDSWGNAGPYLAAGDREAVPGAPLGPFLPIAVPPALLSAYEAEYGRWASVTGRFDAPQAASCTTDSSPLAGTVPTPAEIVQLCRSSFVLTAIEPAPDPCPADATLEAILGTPEPMRADCFGGQDLTFTATGFGINNTWPGISLPPVLLPDWLLGDGVSTDTLAVSVPTTVSLPDPSGTPWEDSDTPGDPETWWKVTGHFDDPAADDCLPDPGDTIDASPVARSLGEVRSFCRNRLVVDRLTWLPGFGVAASSPLAKKATPLAEGLSEPDVGSGGDVVAGPTPTVAIVVTVALTMLVFVVASVVASVRARRS